MKITIVLLNKGRGSGEVARQHVRELIRRGHDVTLVHPGIGAGVPGATNVDVPLHRPLQPVHEYLPASGENQQAVSTMAADLALAYVDDFRGVLERTAADADLVIGHHGNISSVAAGEFATRAGIPHVLFLHGTGIEPRLHGGYDDEVWARIEQVIIGARGLLVTTEYVRRHLVDELIDVPAERFLVLPVGVDTEEFRPGTVGDVAAKFGLPERYVICPGAITRLKGTHNVAEASSAYAHLAPTIFIGDGDERARLEAEIGDRGRFLGFVSAEDKAHLINGGTILTAAPEKLEHFGIVYIEAMAGGTVPVAYHGGGVDSIITDEVGIRTTRHPDALGSAIAELLNDNPRRESMASRGRRRAIAEYSASSLGDRLERWLSELVPRD